VTDQILVDISDRVGLVTLNRPASRNALSGTLLRQLRSSMAALEADDGVDVVILTGADPAFCAGIDLRQLASGDDGIAAETVRPQPWEPLTKPVIGAINGVALTGGLELALACSFRIASDRAQFADTHARVGIHPAWGLTVLLSEAVGSARARQMSVTGNFVPADVALAWGLVNQIVPHEDLLPVCRRLAADIVSADQAALRRVLDTYDRIASMPADEARAYEYQTGHTWRSGRAFDPATVAARRADVLERGRTQQG
jgi:enoyl-CoA hydratase